MGYLPKRSVYSKKKKKTRQRFSLQQVFSRQFFSRLSSPQMMVLLAIITILMVVLLITLPRFKSDQVSVDTANHNSPQYAYSLDELALLKLALDNALQAEQQKNYPQLYQQTSRQFRSQVSEDQFLAMSSCVSDVLGDIVTYDKDNQGFRRINTKKPTSFAERLIHAPYYDTITLHVSRTNVELDEQFVFEKQNERYLLGGIYWMTRNKSFQDCAQTAQSQWAANQQTGLDQQKEKLDKALKPIIPGH